MKPAVQRPGPVQALLAVVLPLVILGLATWAYTRPQEYEVSHEAKTLDAKLRDGGPPDIVVLGNSLAGMDVDGELMAQGLGEGLVVTKLHVNQTRPPTWYAVLKNRVYANGYSPKLVVIVGLLSMALETTEEGDNGRALLEAQMTPDDHVILDKAFGQDGPPAWQRARRRKTQVRQDLLLGTRDLVIGGLYGDSSVPWLERGQLVSEEALNRVFGAEGAVDLGLNRRVIPIVENEYTLTQGRMVEPETSFLPDFAALASAHGSRVVFVRVPLPPSNMYFDRRLGPELEREAIELMNELGIGYLDLSQLDIPDTGFEDFVHLNKAGRAILSKELGAILAEWDALGSTPFPKATPPLLPLSVERVGRPPELPPITIERDSSAPCTFVAPVAALDAIASIEVNSSGLGELSPVVLLEDGAPLEALPRRMGLGEDCSGRFVHLPGRILFTPKGDAEAVKTRRYTLGLSSQVPLTSAKGDREYWVYPGTSLVLRMPPPAAAQKMDLRVVADAFGPIGAVPTMRVGGGEPAPFVVAGARMAAELRAPAPSSEWTIEIASPADGPYVAIRTVAVTEDGATAYAIGSAKAEVTPPVRIVGKPTQTPTPAWWDAPPAPVAQGATTLTPAGTTVELQDYAPLSVMRLRGRFGKRVCDPIRVYEDDQPLEFVGCNAVRRGNAGVFCHEGGRVLYQPSDGETHVYHVGLDPARACDKGLWVYPGDTLHVRTTEGGFVVGADRLDLRGTSVTDPGDAKLKVQLSVRDWVVLDTEVPVSAFASGDVLLDLERRIPPDDERVVLTVTNPADGPWFVLDVASLSESRPFAPLVVGSPELTRVGVEADGRPGLWLLLDGAPPAKAPVVGQADTVPTPGAPVARRGGRYGWEIPQLAPLDPAQLKAAGLEGCWPLVVLEDGRPLQGARQAGDWIEFTPTGRAEDHHYTLTWTTQHACGGAVWVFPKQALRMSPVGASLRDRAPEGPTRLEVHARALSAEGKARIRAGIRPDLAIDEVFDGGALDGTAWTREADLPGGALPKLTFDLGNRTPLPIVVREIGFVPVEE